MYKYQVLDLLLKELKQRFTWIYKMARELAKSPKEITGQKYMVQRDCRPHK